MTSIGRNRLNRLEIVKEVFNSLSTAQTTNGTNKQGATKLLKLFVK